MSISNFFHSFTPTNDQVQAIEQLELFIENENNIFILQGYAGTGKTTLIKALVGYLNSKQKKIHVMAPTGRAAKILREKTKLGSTIHKSIYNFKELESINKTKKDEAEHSFHYIFPINQIESSNQQILIVDESSMISNTESKHELFTFGTNHLLNDLLTYSATKTTKNKIIFIGDPAQLPPVTDNTSRALQIEYFENLGYKVQESQLKEVKRQSDNLILKNSTKIRDLIEQEKRTTLEFDYDSTSFVKLSSFDVIDQFLELYPKPEIGDGVIISYSNQQCYQYNQAIRRKLFPSQFNITEGDLLLLNNNNYHTYGVELFNGDILKVISVENSTIKQSAPVWCEENGHKVRKEISLEYREIKIRALNHPEDITCLIIDSHLHSINKDLSVNEMKSIYINFIIRFNEEQKKRKDANLTVYEIGSDEFKDALKVDPFYNALRVKFGYAITCHKAQGGEWKNVFVDYFGQVSLKTAPLRWCYTATTRAIDKLYAISPPNFGHFSKLKFSTVGKIGTIPSQSLFLDNIQTSPYHTPNQHKAKSLKYWGILEKIENTDFEIVKIESKDYLERYVMKNNEKTITIDGHHKASGHFVNPFKVTTENIDNQLKEKIESIFNEKHKTPITPEYKPSKYFLEQLYSFVQSSCLDLDISITNIVEDQYFVNYYLITDSICSFIQFYFNDKETLTTAIPKTFNCENDQKLILLTEKLINHVI